MSDAPTPKRRGRPALDVDDATTPVSVKMTNRQIDETCRRASAARVNLSEQIRRDVAAAAKDRSS